MIQNMINLIQTQAQYDGHDLDLLERGLIPFATIKQVGFIAGLLRKCGCPEEWRLWLTGQLVGRELRSSKDLSFPEARAIIDVLLVGADGKGDSETEPCEWAKETIGQMLVEILAYGSAKVIEREGGKQHVEVPTEEAQECSRHR